MPNSFGDVILGNGYAPGIFGSGVYGNQAGNYNLPGFDQMSQQFQGLAQQNMGMQTPMRQATPQDIAQQIIAQSLNVSGITPGGTLNAMDVGKNLQTQVPTGPATMGPGQTGGPGNTDFRGQQQALANSLFGTLSGQTPSVAQQQLQQTTQSNIANQYAMAAAHGNNPAMARMAAMNAGNLNQQAAGQGALLRAQEIQNAQGGLSGLLGGARGQDISGTQGFLGQNLQASGMQQQGGIALDQARMQAYQGGAQNSIGGKALSAAGQVAGAAMAAALAHGGVVPGYAGGGPINSYRNDTVPAMLSPGEIVLPRSVAFAEDAPERAREFVEAIRKQKRMKRAA